MWRELYSEKMVVAEERRLRVDDSPMGKYQVLTSGDEHEQAVLPAGASFACRQRQHEPGMLFPAADPSPCTLSLDPAP